MVLPHLVVREQLAAKK